MVLAPFLLALTALAPLQEDVTAPTRDLAEEFAALAERARTDWQVPGLAVAVVKDGKVLLAKGFGVREAGRAETVDEHTLFAIGSTTKAMTAAALGMLVAEGRLAWDDPVTQHLPAFATADPWVTRELNVRDLLTHHAGLGNADAMWYRQDVPTDEVLERIRLIPSAYSFRGGFGYQNLMYVAAGAVLEAVDGRPWTRFLEERLFGPLGMTDTVPLGSVAAMREDVARPHAEVGGAVTVIENASVDGIAPAGAVWSSVSDLARWMVELLAAEPAVLDPAVRDELLRPQTNIPRGTFYPTTRLTDPHWTTYGLGWFQHDYRGEFLCFHTGSIDGMSALVGLVPARGLGVAILANRDHAELRHALWYAAVDRWLGVEDGRDWSADLKEMYAGFAAQAAEAERRREAERVPDTTPSHAVADYAGTYADPLMGNLVVEVRDGALRLTRGEMHANLEHWHFDTYRARFERAWIDPVFLTFEVDGAGKVAAVQVQGRTFRRR